MWSSSTTDSITATRQGLYNRRSELVGAQEDATHPLYLNPYDYTYSYDSAGNRTAAVRSSYETVSTMYTANNLNQYTAVNRTIGQSEQLVLRSFSEGGSNNFTYDADGNLTQDDRFNYTYDDENRLVSVLPRTPYPFNAVENAYDHHNRRIQKVVRGYHEGDWRYHETHTYVWDGWNIVLEQVANGDQIIHTIEYFWGNDLSGSEQGAGGVGGLLATRIDGVFYVPVYGANGNVMMYVDAMGAIAAQFDYDPYGRALAAPNYWENLWNFAFSTKYHDWETDLVAYQLRTYDPIQGRWLNRDPIEEEDADECALYEYCFNSPTFIADVLGLYSFSKKYKCSEDEKSKIRAAMQTIHAKLAKHLNPPIIKTREFVESDDRYKKALHKRSLEKFRYSPIPGKFSNLDNFLALLTKILEEATKEGTGATGNLYPIVECQSPCARDTPNNKKPKSVPAASERKNIRIFNRNLGDAENFSPIL